MKIITNENKLEYIERLRLLTQSDTIIWESVNSLLRQTYPTCQYTCRSGDVCIFIEQYKIEAIATKHDNQVTTVKLPSKDINDQIELLHSDIISQKERLSELNSFEIFFLGTK